MEQEYKTLLEKQLEINSRANDLANQQAQNTKNIDETMRTVAAVMERNTKINETWIPWLQKLMWIIVAAFIVFMIGDRSKEVISNIFK